jgi:hypothetical protein
MALARKKSSSRSLSAIRPERRAAAPRRRHSPKRGDPEGGQFAVCVCNGDYPASLELRKLYPIVEDDFAARHHLVRVIDESGESYLYPSSYFVRVALPKPITQALHRIA